MTCNMNDWFTPSSSLSQIMAEGKPCDGPLLFDPVQDLQALDLHFKSHVYSALGAVLHQQHDFIIWTELDLEELKKDRRISKKTTARSYFSKLIKDRPYSYLTVEDGSLRFGLTPTLQSRRLLASQSDTGTRQWLEERGLKVARVKLNPDDERDFLCLMISFVAATDPEKVPVIQEWLDMDFNERH